MEVELDLKKSEALTFSQQQRSRVVLLTTLETWISTSGTPTFTLFGISIRLKANELFGLLWLDPFKYRTTQKQGPQAISDSLQVQPSRRPSDPSSLDPVLRSAEVPSE